MGNEMIKDNEKKVEMINNEFKESEVLELKTSTSELKETIISSNNIEKWGSGIRRIYKACKNNNVKVNFVRMSDGFKVVFYRRDVPEKVTEKVTENQRRILEIISKNPQNTVIGIAKEIKISRKNVLENISKLKEKGLLKRVGSAKGGYWEVIRKWN